MITTHKRDLAARCRERGYTLDEVMPCVVSQDGETWTIDIDHPAYPKSKKPRAPLPAPPPTRHEPDNAPPTPRHGPGTELKKLLKTWLRIEASPNCSCNARARRMDEMEALEPGWCEQNLDEIVGWLREEAQKRKLPFLDVAGRLLVRRAIHSARKAKKPPLTD